MELESNRSDMGFPNIPEESIGKNSPPKEKKPYPPVDRPVYSSEEAEDAEEKPESSTSYSVFLVAIIFLVAIGVTYLSQTGVIKIPALSQPSIQNRLSDAENGLRIETLRTIGILEELEIKHADNLEKLEKVRTLKANANKILILLEE